MCQTAHAQSVRRALGPDSVLVMADNTKTTSTERAALPILTVPADLAAAVTAFGTLPTKRHEDRVAFGHPYSAGTYTDTTNHEVQRLVWELRTAGHTYRMIAVAIGAQCSMLTERAAGAHARRAKVDPDTWRTNTGGRAAKAAAAVAPPAKTA